MKLEAAYQLVQLSLGGPGSGRKPTGLTKHIAGYVHPAHKVHLPYAHWVLPNGKAMRGIPGAYHHDQMAREAGYRNQADLLNKGGVRIFHDREQSYVSFAHPDAAPLVRSVIENIPHNNYVVEYKPTWDDKKGYEVGQEHWEGNDKEVIRKIHQRFG